MSRKLPDEASSGVIICPSKKEGTAVQANPFALGITRQEACLFIVSVALRNRVVGASSTAPQLKLARARCLCAPLAFTHFQEERESHQLNYDRKDNHSDDGLIVENPDCRAAKKPGNSICRCKETVSGWATVHRHHCRDGCGNNRLMHAHTETPQGGAKHC